MKDGELRGIFRSRLNTYQWTSVETAGTSNGVPDSEFCAPNGVQGWIEFKVTKIFYVKINPFQVSWLMRRSRMGGNAWIAVRRIPVAKKYDDVDELWLMRGDQAETLFYGGLQAIPIDSRYFWSGGPRNWDYDAIAKILTVK